MAAGDLPVNEGDIVAGKYRISHVLGAGGMGAVVAAHHLHLDEKVAIKFLHAELLTNPDAVERFTREARAAVKIKSEYVGRILDVGLLDSGAPYIVMEYLDGLDLSQYIQKNGPLGIELAIEFVLQVCEALAEAHKLGIVHRDLKPANLFCTKRADGLFAVKILDFGISKLLSSSTGASDMGMTKTNTIMGSPYYMSPEQMQSSRDVDARTDIWALGVILHELLIGTPPFGGETLPEICAKVITQPAPSLRERRPDVSPELDAVIRKCIEKQPANRYADVAEVALALVHFAPARARGSVERVLRVVQGVGFPQTGDVTASTQRTTSVASREDTIAPVGQTLSNAPRKRALALSMVAAVGAISAIGAIGALALRNRSVDRPAELPKAATATALGIGTASNATAIASTGAVEVRPVESNSQPRRDVAPQVTVPAPNAASSNAAAQASAQPTKGSSARPPGNTAGRAPAAAQISASKQAKAPHSQTNADDSLGGQY